MPMEITPTSPSPVRVLEFSRGLYPRWVGGREIFVADLATALAERGNFVTVLSEANRRWPCAGIENLRVVRLRMPVVGALAFASSALLSAALRRADFDVVHTHSPRLNVLLGGLIARLLSKPHIITVHCSTTDDALRDIGAKYAYQGAYSIIAVSEEIVRAIQSQLGYLGNVVVIPSSSRAVRQPSGQSDLQPAMRKGRREFTVVYVGRISNHKRPDLLVDALERLGRPFLEHHSVRGVFVGSGPDEPLLKRKVAQSPVRDRIELLGEVPHEDIASILANSDVFVLPSRHEGLGMAVVEAMFSSVPVVVADAPGLRDLVRDGETGFLFPVDDAEALASRLETLIADPSLRTRIGEQARRSVTKHYDFDSVVARHEKLYRASLVDARRPRSETDS